MNNDQLLGELKQATDTLQDDTRTLYSHSNHHKEEIHDLKTALIKESSQRVIELERVLRAVQESNQIATGVVEKVTAIASDMHSLTNRFNGLETTVNEMKQTQFDWSKFLKGCISPKGLLLVCMVGFFITTMFLSMFAPETLPEFFKTIPKTK